ncbi:PIG-L deacetylase family protein [Nitrosopumilus sp. SJ]|nr:PIG-L deacetylase family protein [Nitrosopumilus sp. SJ]
MKALVVAAHPDDEVLGMGGTIKKLTRAGNDIKIVIMATGITSRRSTNYKNSNSYEIDEQTSKTMKTQIEKLRQDAIRSSKILGVKKIEFEDFPDNEMDIVSNLEITKRIEKSIFDFKPDTVFTHSQYDVNVDHRAIFNATITATRPKQKSTVKEVISFEVPSSTEWYFPSRFSPNIFVDIHKELPFKLKALKEYKTELEKFPHPRSLESLEIISKRWGTVSGYLSAEAFYLVRQLKSKF